MTWLWRHPQRLLVIGLLMVLAPPVLAAPVPPDLAQGAEALLASAGQSVYGVDEVVSEGDVSGCPCRRRMAWGRADHRVREANADAFGVGTALDPGPR
jgi:hypothetical protein